jgi:hypothetical protein
METKKPGSPGFLPIVSNSFFINYEKNLLTQNTKTSK